MLKERSPTTTTDLAQLWRRLLFSVLISNTDDHLLNAEADAARVVTA